MLKRFASFFLCMMALTQVIHAQVTTSSITGYIRGDNNSPLPGATVTVTHVPTGTVYNTQTRAEGKFEINNLSPGGPYTLLATFVNFQSFRQEEIYLTLGETFKQDVELISRPSELSTVTISTNRPTQSRGGVETNISRDRVLALPTVGRNITDLLRSVPQAKLTGTEGAISIAGQNNRYNAFYIDGALNNDVFGLSASGTNGGQANIPPISLDAIDQIQVSISPYDASLSGFTGGGINAITRSGTNIVTGSAYFLYRNENLAGKTPTGLKANATRLPNFSDKTTGFRFGGPIIKNKLFFFINGETVRFDRPQTFDPSLYRGATNDQGLKALVDTLRIRYNYNPGGYTDNPETVRADRLVTKIDWNASSRHKVSVSYRLNKGERNNVSASNNSRINFFNNGYVFPTSANTFTAELRSSLPKGISNRLLITYADVRDDRGPLGDPFPRVTINDPTTANQIIFGPDNSSTINLLTQKNFNFLDVVRFTKGKHSFAVGTDNEMTSAYNAFIQNTFGNYTYNSIADFYNNARPASYSVGYSLIDNKNDETTAAAAKFKTLRLALFANDEWRPSANLTLNFALRVDKFSFITQPATDNFTNDSALPKFARYYDLKGARSGLKPDIAMSVSPRVGFTYKIPDEGITVRGGVGMFTGRVPLVWPAGIYNNNGIYQGGFTASASQNANALNTIRFRPDPFNQWRASDVGITLSKGGLNLISAKFRLPKILRTSMGFEKQLGKGWTTSIETIVSKTLNEIYYTNINILPPVGTSVGPDNRSVYPMPNIIPITSNGSNPYDNAILLSNADSNKGFSYNFTFTVDKRFTNGLTFNFNYGYGESVVLHEQTSSVNLSQWRFVETVNGRNNIRRSTSDFSPGHRIFAFGSKRFTYAKKALSTTFSLVYTGQSGSPISYVYQSVNSSTPGPVRDDPSGGNDLLFIPTPAQLQAMSFATTNTVNGVTYTAQQQKDAFEAFIMNNKYLRTHRGQYADRNGDRMPFTNILDMRIAQDFNLKFGSRKVQFQLTYDMFNFTNFLNRNWGRTYFIANDNQQVLGFTGYASATNFTPQYRFNPTLVQARSESFISTTTAPSFSSRWTSQIGLRVNF